KERRRSWEGPSTTAKFRVGSKRGDHRISFRSRERVGACANAESANSSVPIAFVDCSASAPRGWLRMSSYGLPLILSAAFTAQSISAADAPAPATASPAERRQIEEVVVTAERKEAS